jgi:cyanate lyase
MNRNDVTELIISRKLEKGLRWEELADAIGQSKEWSTAACLGQMAMSAEEAGRLTQLLDLPAEAITILQVPPYRGSFEPAIPTDPLIYRFYELVSVYGTTLKALIGEEFGDGIMSAIDFSMNLEREPHAAGDRVKIVMSGKFLPYRRY